MTGPVSPAMRSPQPAGAPIFLSAPQAMQHYRNFGHQPTVSQAAAANHLASMSVANSMMNGHQPPPLMSPAEAGLLYGHYAAAADPYAQLANSMFELPAGMDPSGAGTSAYVRWL